MPVLMRVVMIFGEACRQGKGAGQFARPEVQQARGIDLRILRAMQRGQGIHLAQACFDALQVGGRDEIRLVDEDDIREGDLLRRLGGVGEFLLQMARIHHGDDAIETKFSPRSEALNVWTMGLGSANPVVSMIT